MGITHLSGLSVTSGTSLGTVEAGQVTSSGVSLSGTGVVSLATVTNAASVVTESLALLHQGSGISLVYRSGDTLYVISGVTIADPSLMSQAY